MVLLSWTYCLRVTRVYHHNLRLKDSRQTGVKWYLVAYFITSHICWIISGVSSFVSIRSCNHYDPRVYVLLAYHMNIASDIIAVWECLWVLGLAMSPIFIPGDVKPVAFVQMVVSLLSGVVGLSNSSYCMGGGSGAFSHFSVGLAMFIVASLSREWNYFYESPCIPWCD